jgi:mevalonate kinase
MPLIAAPGKIFLVGEYAVLDGGTAVLAAVNRYAVAHYVAGGQPLSAVVGETVARARAEIGEVAAALPPGSVFVDTDDFHQGNQKLGLGSSAACAVAAAGATFEAAGLSTLSRRQRVFNVADAAHRAAQGGVGSGADVAAAVYGGIIKFARAEGGATVEPLHNPRLHLVVFWVGQPASTANQVEAVRTFGERSPSAYRTIVDKMRATADRFVAELSAGQATGAVAAAGKYGRLMGELGQAAGVAIVTPAFETAAELAHTVGGEAKPSGAGGGDIGIGLFATPEAADIFARSCKPHFTVLSLGLARAGVHRQGMGDASDDPGPFHHG